MTSMIQVTSQQMMPAIAAAIAGWLMVRAGTQQATALLANAGTLRSLRTTPHRPPL